MNLCEVSAHDWLIENHLTMLHAARLSMVKTILPPGKKILDLGGINAPLFRMGYPHEFNEMVLVDLPAEDRHEMYRSIEFPDAPTRGSVSVVYADMTNLKDFDNNSFDFVWSGQSIEHVPIAGARSMVSEAFRVLEDGGVFCLDTPNGAISSLHAATAGVRFIHPEHYHEWTVAELTMLLADQGFCIERSLGLREMPATCATGEFQYSDFALGRPISGAVESSYIQLHICRK